MGFWFTGCTRTRNKPLFKGVEAMKIFKSKIAKLLTVSLLLTLWSVSGSIQGLIFPGNITPGLTAKAEETISFSDVPTHAWYYEDLQYILKDERKIFAGYPDGTFRPNETLTADMYIKLIVTVMGHKVENGIGYWASTYIEKAIDEGYVIPQQDTRISYKTKDDPYAGYKMPISREYMAQIAGRALNKIIDNSEYRDPIAVSSLIKDYRKISSAFRNNIVKCYDLGILTGYPDGEFKPDNYLTRAEAVAVIRRIIDPSARIRAELPVAPNPSPTPIPVSELNRPPKKDLGNGVIEVEGIKFDPSADIANPSNGAMRILKAQEFVGVFLEHLRFYEHEGKARVRGYIPELPDGYEWMIAIHCGVNKPNDLGYYECILTNNKDDIPEYRMPFNGKTFDMPLYTNQENIRALVLTCEIKSASTSASGGYHWISFTEGKLSVEDTYGGFDGGYPFDSGGFFEW